LASAGLKVPPTIITGLSPSEPATQASAAVGFSLQPLRIASEINALVTLSERVSKKTLIAQVPSRPGEIVTAAIIKLLEPEKEHLHTITCDNGKEFAYHALIKKTLGADNYFAHPYHSWERGLNKNNNEMIPQYLPKGMGLDTVADEDIILIQNRLNNRPINFLGYKIRDEVHDAMSLAA
jgi:IS30 family transposase